jgi:hypothetical protein
MGDGKEEGNGLFSSAVLEEKGKETKRESVDTVE